MNVGLRAYNKKFSNHVGMLCLVVLSVASLMTVTTSYAQRKVTLKQADQLRGGKQQDGTKFERVIGNVIFTQNKTTIYCDSAYFYKSINSIDAFGRIRITEGDSVTITGNKLSYDGDAKKAKLRNNVVFTKLATSTLYTDNLDFDRPRNTAYYFNGGRLVDSINVLTKVIMILARTWHHLRRTFMLRIRTTR
jgi:lipopolysaccharide assembly outer membrane protein LptD (OstA)